MNETCPLSDDLLTGAGKIAEFIFGTATKRRQVYHLAECGGLPVFKLGATLCARRSTLIAWIEAQEATSSGRCCNAMDHASSKDFERPSTNLDGLNQTSAVKECDADVDQSEQRRSPARKGHDSRQIAT